MFSISRWHAAAVFVVLGLLAACDTAPGPQELGQRPPTVSALEITPARLSFSELRPDQLLDGDRARVEVTMQVEARGQADPVREVGFVIQNPDDPAAPLATGFLASAGGDRYAGTAEIIISTLDPEQYPVIVFAVDAENRVSGEIRGQVRYTRSFDPGSPPVVEAVEAPETVQRPPAGEQPVSLQLVAVVSDPDGLRDVARVEFWNVNAPAQRFRLCDDGGGQPCGAAADSGDATAGDGRFTLTVLIASNNSPGVNTFAFQATDRAGLTSNIVEKQITVQ